MQESEGKEEEQLKILQEITVKEFYHALAKSLLLIGKFFKDVGEFQRESKAHKLVFQRPKPSVKLFMLLGQKMIDEIEEEKIGPLVKTLSRTPSISADIFDYTKTSPQEQIEFGEKFIAIAEKIEEILSEKERRTEVRRSNS